MSSVKILTNEIKLQFFSVKKLSSPLSRPQLSVIHKIQIIWWKSSHSNYSIGCLLEAKGTLILNFDPDNVILLVETLDQVFGSNPDDNFLVLSLIGVLFFPFGPTWHFWNFFFFYKHVGLKPGPVIFQKSMKLLTRCIKVF